MLKYLVIQLDDTSTSFCHYEAKDEAPHLIDLADLKNGILFAMKENLNIQFIYPDYELPTAYVKAIESIDHMKIKSSTATQLKEADIVVLNGPDDAETVGWNRDQIYILRLTRDRIGEIPKFFDRVKKKIVRLNVVITDIEQCSQSDFDRYKAVLKQLSEDVEKETAGGNNVQINLLTDRMMLRDMNNCNAGHEVLTLAPNGKFYICPAFYYENPEENCGDPQQGIAIRNAQLYRLDHAPICRHCDAWQCRRCVWLNRRTTMEVNTPSHEQCVTAHLERNESRRLLKNIRKIGTFLPEIEIAEIEYLDPFVKHEEW